MAVVKVMLRRPEERGDGASGPIPGFIGEGCGGDSDLLHAQRNLAASQELAPIDCFLPLAPSMPRGADDKLF